MLYFKFFDSFYMQTDLFLKILTGRFIDANASFTCQFLNLEPLKSKSKNKRETFNTVIEFSKIQMMLTDYFVNYFLYINIFLPLVLDWNFSVHWYMHFIFELSKNHFIYGQFCSDLCKIIMKCRWCAKLVFIIDLKGSISNVELVYYNFPPPSLAIVTTI